MAHPPNNDNLQTYKIVVVGDGGGKFHFFRCNINFLNIQVHAICFILI
jgi:hypothetical protein